MLTICHAIQHFACVNAFNQQLEIVRVLQPFLGEKCMKNSRWHVFVKNRKKIVFYATSEKYIWGGWRTHYFFQQSKKAVVLLSLAFCPSLLYYFFCCEISTNFVYIYQFSCQKSTSEKQQQGSWTCAMETLSFKFL